jgi:protein-disulfide isomerase
MTEHSARDDVSADARDGKRLDIRSTPTLFINGRKVTGTLPDLDRYQHAVLIESRLSEQQTRGEG